MSNTPDDHLFPTIIPFTFDEAAWDKDRRWAPPPNNFAERRALVALQAISEIDSSQGAAVVEELRNNVSWWRELAHLESAEGDTLELQQWGLADYSIDALLARAAARSENAVMYLARLVAVIHSGLLALAMHHDERAMTSLANTLSGAVADFSKFAHDNPEKLRAWAGRRPGIPGIISRFTEQSKANASLVNALGVGAQYPIRLSTGGKRGKTVSLRTRSNTWALRLCSYIEDARAESLRFSLMSPQQLSFYTAARNPPSWLQAAMELPPFAAGSWPCWFDVAWQIVLDSTGGAPEGAAELFSLQSRPKEKPAKRTEKLPNPPSVHRTAIKETLARGFRYLAGAK